jgi:hypothetical protein
MLLPGFTAEASLSQPRGSFLAFSTGPTPAGVVTPQLFGLSWTPCGYAWLLCTVFGDLRYCFLYNSQRCQPPIPIPIPGQ